MPSVRTHLALALLASLPTAVNAERRVELSPFYGYRFGGTLENATTGDSMKIRSAPAYGFALDVNPYGGPEKLQLLWSRQETDIELNGFNNLPDVDVTIDYFQIGGYIEYENYDFVPYCSINLGLTYFDAKEFGSDAYFSFSVGGGVKYYPGSQEHLAIRGDARAYGNVLDGGGFVICNGGNCVGGFSGDVLWQGEVSLSLTLAF